MSVRFWLRCETKDKERRTALTPTNAKKLISLGAEIVVEEDPGRIFPLQDYIDVGCSAANSHSWKEAPLDYYILGLKEIVDPSVTFNHKHIYFAHVFKGQEGAEEILSRYKKDGGTLFDLEYLVNEEGRRISAFGHWAGFAGAAFALDRFFQKQTKKPYPPLKSFESIEKLISQIKGHQNNAHNKTPKVMIIGALGRCGKGAQQLFDHFDIKATPWDFEETKKGGPFVEILEHDLFINAALITKKIPPFIDHETLKYEKDLSIIADVSCDPNSDLNPIPIYDEITSWDKPFYQAQNDVEVLGVDNLPSTLPLESSIDFSGQLLPWLEELVTKKGSLPLPFENAQKTFESFLK